MWKYATNRELLACKTMEMHDNVIIKLLNGTETTMHHAAFPVYDHSS